MVIRSSVPLIIFAVINYESCLMLCFCSWTVIPLIIRGILLCNCSVVILRCVSFNLVNISIIGCMIDYDGYFESK